MSAIDSLNRKQQLLRMAMACAFVPLSLFAISLVVAFLLYGPLAREPRRYFTVGPRPEDSQVIEHQLGLDESWYRHGLQWPIDAARGELGTSAVTGRDVRHLIIHGAPMSAEMLVLSMAVGALVALALATLRGRSQRRHARKAIFILGAALASIPGFVALLLLILLPSDYLKYSPPVDHTQLTEHVWNNLRLIGPIAIVIGTIGGAATWSTLESGRPHLRHIVGRALSQVPFAMSGIILAERLFSIGGVGSLLWTTTITSDLPAVQSLGVLILFVATLAYALRRALTGTSAPEAPVEEGSSWSSPLFLAAMAGIALFVTVGVLAPFIEPSEPSKISFTLRNQSPSLQHILGTTNFGQDELSRVIEGTRTSVKFTAAVLAFGFLPGGALGLAVGRRRKRLHRTFDALAEAVVSLPALVLILLLVAARGPGLDVVAIPVAFVAFAMGVRAAARPAQPDRTAAPEQSWLTRGARLSPAFFEAAILALLAEATVGFLGLGASLPGSSLGSEIQSASSAPTHEAALYGPAAALYIGLLSCALAAIACSQLVDTPEPRVPQDAVEGTQG